MKRSANASAIRSIVPRALATALVILPGTAAAQAPAIHPGDEVRVTWEDARYVAMGIPGLRRTTAEVVNVNVDYIQLERGSRRITVPTWSVRAVEKRVGTKPASAPAMVAGSGIGFAGGFAIGMLTGAFDRTPGEGSRTSSGIATGILVGAPVGALIAYITSRSRGIYADVGFGSVLASLTVDANGGVGISIPTGN